MALITAASMPHFAIWKIHLSADFAFRCQEKKNNFVSRPLMVLDGGFIL